MRFILLFILIVFVSSSFSSSRQFEQSDLFKRIKKKVQELSIKEGSERLIFSNPKQRKLLEWIDYNTTFEEKQKLISNEFLDFYSNLIGVETPPHLKIDTKNEGDKYILNDYYLQLTIGIPELGLNKEAQMTFEELKIHIKDKNNYEIVDLMLKMNSAEVRKSIDEEMLVKSKSYAPDYKYPYVLFDGDLYLFSYDGLKAARGTTYEVFKIKVEKEKWLFDRVLKEFELLPYVEQKKALKEGFVYKVFGIGKEVFGLADMHPSKHWPSRMIASIKKKRFAYDTSILRPLYNPSYRASFYYLFEKTDLFKKIQKKVKKLRSEDRNPSLSKSNRLTLALWVWDNITQKEKKTLISKGFLYKTKRDEFFIDGVYVQGSLSPFIMGGDYSISDYYIQMMGGIPELGVSEESKITLEELRLQINNKSNYEILNLMLRMDPLEIKNLITQGVLFKVEPENKLSSPYVHFEGVLYHLSDDRISSLKKSDSESDMTLREFREKELSAKPSFCERIFK